MSTHAAILICFILYLIAWMHHHIIIFYHNVLFCFVESRFLKNNYSYCDEKGNMTQSIKKA